MELLALCECRILRKKDWDGGQTNGALEPRKIEGEPLLTPPPTCSSGIKKVRGPEKRSETLV